jgi:hypothetical protein
MILFIRVSQDLPLYQSRDIADQVSFNINIARIKLLSSTSKKKNLRFSYSKRFSTIIKILEPDQNFLMTAKRKG